MQKMRTHLPSLLILITLFQTAAAQVPVLNSRPAITNKVIYLDFDGQVVSGTGWNSGNTVNALPSTLSSANMIITWKRVSEDFIPFDVNVTTDSTRFNQAPANRRMRVIITPTSAWYGAAGGVAYVSSFAWGGTPGTPCWVFENQLGYSAKNVAEAASHEAGHTLSLRHQSTYSTTPTCTKTAEYNPGLGTGVNSWAPIMGVGYSRNVTTWFNGTSSQGCNIIQNDHGSTLPGITGPNFLSFVADDVGDMYATGKTLNMNNIALVDSGLITTPTDVDVYKFTLCNNRYISIGIKPWALDTVNYNGANLDVQFALYNAATNSLLASDASLNRLHTLAGVNLGPGSYYFTVDGSGSPNYSDYGSLGRYYLEIITSNAPLFANTIVTDPVICQGQATTLSYTSTGVPSTFQWQVAGPASSTSSAQYPSLTFSTAGTYTITLQATNAFLSCPSTKTIAVQPQPSIGLSPSLLTCKGTAATLTASGASSYTWVPGGLQGSTQTVTPTVTTTYSITGTNGVCSNTAAATVSVSPDFTLSVTASSTLFCVGDTISLSATGAASYTFDPGALSGNLVQVTPTSPVTYVITGANADGCTHQASLSLVLQECSYTGIALHSPGAAARLYPNPNSGEFFIETAVAGSIVISDCLGRLVYSGTLTPGKNSFDLRDQASGIYFIRLDTPQQQLSRKWVKE